MFSSPPPSFSFQTYTYLYTPKHSHIHSPLSPLPQPLPAKPEPPTVARVKGSPPMQRAHSSNEPSSRKAPKPQQMHKGHSVDDRTMLNSRGTDPFSQQTPVPRAATDFRASAQPHPTSPLVQQVKPALSQSFQFTPADHRGDHFDRPPIPPRSAHAELPEFRGAPSVSHAHSAGFTRGSGGGIPSTRPPHIHGGWGHSSNVAMAGPPRSQHNVSPITTGGYHDSIPRASTRPDAPLGYHHQPQPPHLQKRLHHSSLHPGYPNASPSSLPPMPSISGEVNTYHRHAQDDSGLYRERTPDFVEKDSPPSSNISSQSSQPPEASQQLLQYARGHRQPAGVTAGVGSGRQDALPTPFYPANSPRPQQTYLPQQREPSYPTPMSRVPVSHQPIPHAQFDHRGTNTTSNLLDEPRSRHTPHAHTANLHYSVQETQQGPSPQVKYPPRMQGEALNTVTSQPNQGQESNQLEVGIEREIYAVAKNVIKSDSEAPQTLADEDIPYDPNLICPKCKLNFRIGEIQKYRRHVKTCQVSRK